MSFGAKAAAPVDPSLLGVDVSQQPSSQEATPLVYAAGQYSIGAQWLSGIYNQKAVEAPNAKPGKK